MAVMSGGVLKWPNVVDADSPQTSQRYAQAPENSRIAATGVRVHSSPSRLERYGPGLRVSADQAYESGMDLCYSLRFSLPRILYRARCVDRYTHGQIRSVMPVR